MKNSINFGIESVIIVMIGAERDRGCGGECGEDPADRVQRGGEAGVRSGCGEYEGDFSGD